MVIDDRVKTPAAPEKPEKKTNVTESSSADGVQGELTNPGPLEESKSLLKDFQIYVKSFGVASVAAVTVFVAMRAGIEKSSCK